MSLNSRMAEFTHSQFLSTRWFAEEVLFYKGDDASTAKRVCVMWDADLLPGTNEVEGDGVVLEKRSGRRIRESLNIECESCLNVDDKADPPDRFVRGKEVALVKRIMGRDPGGMMMVRCIRVIKDQNRGQVRMG